VEKPVSGKVWKATPGTRMMELLHASDVPLGLITNGEQWMLVYAPRGETTGFASWYADIWMQEPITLRAFHSLLHLRRFLGVADLETLAALYRESSKDQQEVTEQLGNQVRQAVGMLVHAFDQIDAESGRSLLAGVSEKTLYDSALTVMMRLVFLFSAEERGLLLLGDRLYDQNYAVSTLSELLRERADQQGEEVLERRHDAWCRLLSTFRAVHAGVEHDAMRLPAYGGTLFDPDRYPFLEGRGVGTQWLTTGATPLPIDNRVVLHLLEALQVLRVRVPGGGPAEARRISFRALDIEQIGHVYEGLLDHTAKRASEIILGLDGSKNHQCEIPLSKIEEIADEGTEKLIEFLNGETGRSLNALKRLINEAPTQDEHVLMLACGQNGALAKRLKPFASLLRKDSFDKLVVIPEGSFYVTVGTDRRSTGTHYTPRSLTEPIVQHTLEPLVYKGVSEGQPPKPETLKTAREILALKICDMAMGSGAFLVQGCRYMAERLVEAWEIAEKLHPGCFVVTPEGELSRGSPAERLLPNDIAERLTIARRFVADRCLYGVDINPMAVEMAKLSLWLITLQRDRPFTFLDHAVKCGDSLLGVSSIKQIENFSLRPGEQQATLGTLNLYRYTEAATAKRRELEELPSNGHAEIETKTRLHAEAEAATAKVKALADTLIAFELRGLDGDAYEEQRVTVAETVQLLMKRDADASLKSRTITISELSGYGRDQLRGRHPFHWPVEFPEVFARGGFDAFVGNPPFMGGGKIAAALGSDYAVYLHKHCWEHAHGNADFVAYFFLRAAMQLRMSGIFGLVATNTIAQGDTADTGLRWLVKNRNLEIVNAIPSFAWPGAAAVVVSIVVGRIGQWSGLRLLDGVTVASISASLDASGTNAKPYKLIANAGLSSEGSKLYAKAFVLDESLARKLIAHEPEAAEVVRQFNTGEDFNNSPTQSPSRWCVDFRTFGLDEVTKRWPKTLAYVEEFVKPERERVSDERARELWWQHQRPRPDLYAAARPLQRVLAKALVTSVWGFAFVETKQVFANKITVFLLPQFKHFALLQSSIHEAWAWTWGSTMKTDLNYSHSDCFQTFPFPTEYNRLDALGEGYHEFRRQIMQVRQQGLTKTYHHFHNRGDKSEDIARLRALHLEMDQAVAAAYGWSDLDLGHGFHTTKQGERYTMSEAARRTALDRLLRLNHDRYAEEIAQGLHDAKKLKYASGTRKATVGLLDNQSLFAPPSYPSSLWDYAVCAVAFQIVAQSGSITSAKCLDALIFTTQTDFCAELLDAAHKKTLKKAKSKAPKALFPENREPLRWRTCRDHLERLGVFAIEHGATDPPIRQGKELDRLRSKFDGNVVDLVALALTACKRMDELLPADSNATPAQRAMFEAVITLRKAALIAA